MERMDEYHMLRWVLMAEVIGGRVRGGPIEEIVLSPLWVDRGEAIWMV